MEQVPGWRWTLRIAGGVFLGQALFVGLAYLIVPGLLAAKESAAPEVEVSGNAEIEAARLEAEADRTARER